jgi:pilus assembly protein Flp/PilA
MQRMKAIIRTFIVEEEGAAVAEYGLLLGIIAIGIVTILLAFRSEIVRIWNGVVTEFSTVPDGPEPVP